MADISVNEYVRTKRQGIKKIDRIDENKTVNKYLYFIGYDHNDREYGIIKTTDILRHSFNLIDLIEVGDYVNGGYVDDKTRNYIVFYENGGETLLTEKAIKTIVTKEQMEAIQYVV